MGTHYLPLLYNQSEMELIETSERTQVVQDALQTGLSIRALKHKNAILAELQRRKDVENAKIKADQDAKKAKERRQERRKCLKEQKRILEIQENLISSVISVAEQREFNLNIPVYDIREYNSEAPPGIYTYGGFIGEVIVSLFSL